MEIEKTVFACQTFVVTIPTWLSVALAGAALVGIVLRGTDIYYTRKLAKLRAARPTSGDTHD